MKTSVRAAAALVVTAPLWWAAAAAHDAEELGPAIREYLLDNPEVIVEAIEILRMRQEAFNEEASQARAREYLAENAAAVFEDGYSAAIGPADADLTLVEFYDYRCGYCQRAFGEAMAFFLADGSVRYVFKDYPILGEASEIAARASIAAAGIESGERFLAFHTGMLFHGDALDEETVLGLAEEAGYELETIRAVMWQEDVDEKIWRNRAMAEALGITGTPGFVLGDEVQLGLLDEEQLAAWAARVRAGRT